jgi:general secretion pathway protein K
MYREEAIQAALGAESWVRILLQQDSNDSETDHLGEIWASDLPVLPLGAEGDTIQGEIYGQIEDLQGRFNINNLIDQQGEVDQESLEQFTRLLAALGIDVRFAGIAADWIDADREAGFPDGAEDAIYTGLVPPYRTANQILSSTSELAALEGMDKATMDVLLPHIVALPGRTGINVNTATGPVLQSLDENMTIADVEGLLAEREEQGFADLGNSFSSLVTPDVLNQLEETSDFFQLKVIVRVDTVRITLFSLLERGPQGDTSPILRSLGTT